MSSMDITHDNYQVRYDESRGTITYHGSFRLRGEEYKPILDLLIAAADSKPQTVILDARGLEFLNSSGINTLSKFIVRVRKHNTSQVIIQGNYEYSWQQKSFRNLQRLLPEMRLEIT